MTRTKDLPTAPRMQRSDWSNRLLALGVSGILFLTLYPFEVGHAKWHGHRSVFLLGHGAKTGGPLDIFLNILLFVPFGLACGTKLLRNGKSWRASLLYTTLAGALFSYGIELAQLYIPARDSGWADVFTNTTGAAVGLLAASLFGAWLFSLLSRRQEHLRLWLTPRRAAFVLLIYFAAWCAGSISLEKEVNLNTWRTDSFLIFGNDATGRHRWNGTLLQMQIWNRALPAKAAQELTARSGQASVDNPVVNLDFERDASATPLPAAGSESRAEESSVEGSPTRAEMGSASPVAVPGVVKSLKQANQFSIRAVLEPARAGLSDGRILSLSQRSGFTDFFLNQEKESLVFWFRNTVLRRRLGLHWKIPNAVAGGRVRTVLFSYDGSAIQCYIDGKEDQHHPMGPAAALAGKIRYIKEAELNGYRDIYYALVFFPAGALLGVAMTPFSWRRADLWVLLAVALLAIPTIFESLLAHAGGGSFSSIDVALSAALLLLGILWMHADRREATAP